MKAIACVLLVCNLASADVISSKAAGRVASVYFNNGGASCPAVEDSMEIQVVAQEGPDNLVDTKFTALVNGEYDGLPDWSTGLFIMWPIDRPHWNANGPYARRIGGEGYVSFRNPEVFEWSWRIGGAETLCQLMVDSVSWEHEVLYYNGDANRDTRFDSRDLVAVFSSGEYDDGIPGNSTWETGDWTGDFEFDSSDLVAAMITGRYVSSVGVPEPSVVVLFLIGLTFLGVTRWRSKYLTGVLNS